MEGTFEVLKGPPADTKASISAALCARTKADGAAAIVIGSASRGGLKEALLGSIAANLAHNCEVPVVVLHRPQSVAAGAGADDRAIGSPDDASDTGHSSSGKARKQQQQGSGAGGDVTWLLRATTQELLGEAASEQLERSAAATTEAQQVRCIMQAYCAFWGCLVSAVVEQQGAHRMWCDSNPAARELPQSIKVKAVKSRLSRNHVANQLFCFVCVFCPINPTHPQTGGARPQTAQQRNLVVAIDDSEEGYGAVGWVLQHLWRPGDILHLLHVVPALPAHMSYSLAPGVYCRLMPMNQKQRARQFTFQF